MKDINHTIQQSVRSDTLQHQAMTLQSPLISKEKELDSELIVSLTTFSKKIHDVHLVIESIGQQTLQANRIILWLDEKEFSLDTLPKILHRQVERGLEVRFCPDYRSYKKIIPTLKLAPDAYIITVDDDVLYAYNFIENLLAQHHYSSKTIIGYRGHEITLSNDGEVMPYKRWRYSVPELVTSHQVMLTGVGGIFYPPNSLHPDVIDINLFMKLAPSADDLWLKIMAIRQGTECKKLDYAPKSYALKDHRDIGLAHENVKKGGNDRQFKLLLDYFPEVKEALVARTANTSNTTNTLKLSW
ncbi:hypothetical protein EDB51_12559 [Vibrio crassostreae]|nr:hypothetical protein EDB51_12559 [Vibrio crassostreae]